MKSRVLFIYLFIWSVAKKHCFIRRDGWALPFSWSHSLWGLSQKTLWNSVKLAGVCAFTCAMRCCIYKTQNKLIHMGRQPISKLSLHFGSRARRSGQDHQNKGENGKYRVPNIIWLCFFSPHLHRVGDHEVPKEKAQIPSQIWSFHL